MVHPPYNTGGRRQPANKAGVDQLGNHVGDHVTGQEGNGGATDYIGVPIFDGGRGYPSELGNAKAAELSGNNCGPGKGRNTSRAGSQGSH